MSSCEWGGEEPCVPSFSTPLPPFIPHKKYTKKITHTSRQLYRLANYIFKMIKDFLKSRTNFSSYWTRRKIQCKYSGFVTVSRYLSFYVFYIKIKFCGIVTWRILFKIRLFMIMRCDWSFLRILKYLGHESEEKTAATDGAVSQLKMSITKQMLKVLKDLIYRF